MGVVLCKSSILKWLGGSICLLYICTVLDLAVGVVLCKSSILKWLGGPSAFYIYAFPGCSSGCSVMQVHLYSSNWGVHLPSIYMYCPRSSFGCSGMHGICAQLTGGVHLPSIYMHCPRSSSGCSGMKDFYIQMTWEDLCCMVLCFANVFGVVVFNSHMLDWLRGPSAFFIYVLS